MTALARLPGGGSGGTSTILVVYKGSPAALVGVRRLSFLGDIRNLPPGDPVVRLVAYMAYYARLVLAGEMPSPYSDEEAERFARLALVEPNELARLWTQSDDAVAAYFGVPVEQVRRARHELEGPDGS